MSLRIILFKSAKLSLVAKEFKIFFLYEIKEIPLREQNSVFILILGSKVIPVEITLSSPLLLPCTYWAQPHSGRNDLGCNKSHLFSFPLPTSPSRSL